MNTPKVDAYEILERITDGFFALDENWNFTYVNAEAARLLFRSRDDLIGKNIWDEFPESVNLTLHKYLHKAVLNQKPVKFDAFFPLLEKWFDVRAYPLLNGLTIYFKDITQEKREHDALFQLISENSQDLISIATPEGRTQYVSPSIKTLLGYEPEEVIGTFPYEFCHPDDVITLTNSDFLKKSNEAIFVCRVRHKNGHYVWFETAVKTIRNDHGEIVKTIGIGRDITKRKQAEEELRKTKERLESFIQNNADAIWVIDLEDRVLEINPAFETMFGWSADSIIGKKLPIIPDFAKDSTIYIHEKIKKGVSMAGLETIRQRKDGSLLDVSATLSPIRDSAGKVIGITGICRDIARRKKAEDALKVKSQQLESFIENFIENNVDAILIFNMQGNVVRVNKAFEDTFCWTKQEIIGVRLFDLPCLPPEVIEEVKKFYVEVKKGNYIIGTETILLRKDGVILNVILTISPIHDPKGNMDGCWISIRDITEWKKSQEMLQITEKLSVAGQLAAGIAHEIRNPMTSIKGFIHLMKSDFGDKKEYFDIMSSELERIEQILSELLILAKPQISKFEQKDVRILLTQVITLMDAQAILNNVEIVTEIQPEVTHIHCDENQLKQAFINYIKNAIEAMPTGGKLVIQIRKKENKRMIFRFIDQGIGMPKEILSKLGQAFYTTKEKGTGLGFMVSKKIIENHSGEVHIESEVNKGTIIEVNLPLTQENC
ncbi:PAS/PAC sensor signal transduction histidine kinase [Bacillus methanolicus PB1]|uniref:histidine kinase n=1 Tax=Bacillus methanolicus PB1 TaxID=997296 RepID=I3E2D1_BACMT|nr:PAS domain-containing sensor histidine kinase [Bacillus methanolicus]EIJ80652.1 PAS/PAC sensor signal transduction histidine kinase [Bacillus methanolicus PB1]